MKFNDLQLADVRLFATATEKGSLAAAAALLSVPKASASRALQRLEASLGRSLLHRSAGRFALTDEGRTFLPSAHRMLANMDQAVAELRAQGGPLKGNLRISAPYKFGRTRIAPYIADFLVLNPEVDITLELGSHRIDLLADEADLAVRIGDVGGDSLVARLLTTEQIMLCASPAYLAANGHPALPKDLAFHRLLTMGSIGQSAGLVLSCQRQTHRIAVSIALRSNEPEVLAEAAAQGAGIAHLPASFAAKKLATGALVAVLPDLDLLPVNVNAVYAPGRRQSRKVRAFLDFLIDRMQSVESSSLRIGAPQFGFDVESTLAETL